MRYLRYIQNTQKRDTKSISSRALQTVEKELQRVSELERSGRGLSSANKKYIQSVKENAKRIRSELDALQPLKRQASKFVPFRILQSAVSGRLKMKDIDRNQRAAPAAKASAADRRKYGPAPQEVRNPRSVFGTDAHLSVNSLGRHLFRTHYLVVPCIQRQVRREVLHAFNLTERASRSKKRRGPFSHIWC